MLRLDSLSQRDRRAIILGAAALLGLVVVRWGLMPFVNSWQGTRAEIASCRGELDTLESQLRLLLGQRRRLESMYGPAVHKPPGDADAETLKFREAIQTAVGSSGMREPKYTPQPARVVPSLQGVQTIGMRVRGQCQLAQLTRCLAELRAADCLIIVDNISITSNQANQANQANQSNQANQGSQANQGAQANQGNQRNQGNLDVTLGLMTLVLQEQGRSCKRLR